MCGADVKDQVVSVPGSPGYACQLHQTPIAARHQTPQSFRANQFTTLHQKASRPLVHSSTMHHSPTVGHNLPSAYLTSRPAQQRRDTFTDLTRGTHGTHTFTDLATPQRPMLGASFMQEFESPGHNRLHHSQGNIYAEVENDYEVDSGFTEESVDLTSDRSNRAAIVDNLPRSRSSKPYLGKKHPANPVYSSDDSELDQGRRHFAGGRATERRVWKQEDPKDGRFYQESRERGRYDKLSLIHI